MIDRLHLYLLDIAAMLVIGVFVAYAMTEKADPYWVLAGTMASLIVVPVLFRRLQPTASLVVSTTAMVISVVIKLLPVEAIGAPLTAVGCTLYTVAVEKPRKWSLIALAAVCLALVSVTGGLEVENIGLVAVSMSAVWTFGYMTRMRRTYAARTAAQQAEQALADERMRIARELHDVVAHNLSLITVQAGTAAHVRSPDAAYAALETISETSRAALTEMRHLLGVLRSDATTAPAPGLASLPDLADRASLAGVTVSLDVRGDSVVPEGVGLSVYRIVQEALTNVVKHAAPASCTAVVEVTPDLVRIEVVDDGPGMKELGTGHGLIGMRERVAVYGGTFAAGPAPERGFKVTAELPYR